MGMDPKTRRRWFGAVVLVAALAMLIAGETLLPGRLSNAGFLLYWLVCSALTGLAIVVAFVDVRATQRRVREEQRDLFETTLRKIEQEQTRRKSAK